MSRSITKLGLCALATTALLASACTTSDEAAEPSVLGADTARATFSTNASVGQLTVTGAEPGVELTLYSDAEEVVSGNADDEGALIFRELDAGEYRVAAEATDDNEEQVTGTVELPTLEESLPERDFYAGQTLEPGYTYIETRDGTQLSASVYLPGPAEDGPYPTVVEYSGYDPAKPGGNLLESNAEKLEELGIDAESLCETVEFLCNAPAQPSSIIALGMGYAVVAVNVRGTGCSGGAYDYNEPLQTLDGYDVIETVASQDWVYDNKVGMVGLSYPGITQLFVARAQPPSLAAITPLSVMDDTVRGLLAPGGIHNEGFALSWAEQVLEKAEPLGQGWEEELIEDGDAQCAENQKLRGQNVDVTEVALSYDHYPPELGDWYNPSVFGEDIEVPIFLSGSFQDEQTGGRFPLLWDKFPNSPLVRFSMWNGAHADGFAPMNLSEWKAFLDLYVADQVPTIPPIMNLLAPILMEDVFGATLELEAVPYSEFDTVEEARAAYEAEKPVRLILENGASDPEQPGAPGGTAEYRFDQWPPADVSALPFYLNADGTLTEAEPLDDGGASRYDVDGELAETVTLPGGSGDAFKALPDYEWAQEPAGSAAVFVSEPLTEDLALAGSASADLFIRSSAPEADIGVTLSEVRPDGQEVYIQSGVLRGSMRATEDNSTELWPNHSGYEEDASPMPVDEFTEARVEIFPFAHVVRAGSRIRLSVHTPGGDRVRWAYILADGQEGASFDVAHNAEMASRLVLPVTSSITGYPAELPPCPGLRAQPCREFADYLNTPAS
ncbi:MAG: CocE/NonD family hydrolase [Actinomycetia bacterium]|nr:CocE/NonD family hydrolase [Actinomycetes bacterium]